VLLGEGGACHSPGARRYHKRRGREAFILQHVVDAFGAQVATAADANSIMLIFPHLA
jgi:hypothetical protein